MPKITALNLACGRDYRKDWINIDNQQMYNGDFPVDIKADITELDWENNTVDCILVNHFIQYTTPEKLEVLLKRWLGWLKHGGSIYIEAGDILNVCRNILNAKTIEELNGKDCIMQLYGIDNNIWNKWAWCPATLTFLMDKVGYKELFTGLGSLHHNPSRDFLTVGYKVDNNKTFIAPPFPSLIPRP